MPRRRHRSRCPRRLLPDAAALCPKPLRRGDPRPAPSGPSRGIAHPSPNGCTGHPLGRSTAAQRAGIPRPSAASPEGIPARSRRSRQRLFDGEGWGRLPAPAAASPRPRRRRRGRRGARGRAAPARGAGAAAGADQVQQDGAAVPVPGLQGGVSQRPRRRGHLQAHLLAVLPPGRRRRLRSLLVQRLRRGRQRDHLLPGFCARPLGAAPRDGAGEAPLGVQPLRPQQGRLRHPGGDAAGRAVHLRHDGALHAAGAARRGARRARAEVLREDGPEPRRRRHPRGVPGGLPGGRGHRGLPAPLRGLRLAAPARTRSVGPGTRWQRKGRRARPRPPCEASRRPAEPPGPFPLLLVISSRQSEARGRPLLRNKAGPRADAGLLRPRSARRGPGPGPRGPRRRRHHGGGVTAPAPVS